MAESPSHVRGGARARIEDTLAWVDTHAQGLAAENVPLTEAGGRILARHELASLDLPPFDRAAVDGVAVRAEETVGASTYNPCVLQYIVAPGELTPGGARRINAGEALPGGADAVVRLDYIGSDGVGRATLTEPIVAGSGVERSGSQAARGSTLATAGRRLRPADLALFACAGLERVAVVRRPRVRCLLAEGTAQAGTAHSQSGDSALLRALIERDGGILVEQRTLSRSVAALRHALAPPGVDLIVVAGGTGSGSNDHAARALAEAGEIAIAGVALRHAETTCMGMAAGVPVFLLPGAPAACLLAYEFFAGRALRRRGGQAPGLPFPSRSMTAARKIVSEIGLAELRPVRCRDDRSVEPIPFLVEAGLRALTAADGFVLISEESEGYPQSASLTVYLYNGYGRAQPQ